MRSRCPLGSCRPVSALKRGRRVASVWRPGEVPGAVTLDRVQPDLLNGVAIGIREVERAAMLEGDLSATRGELCLVVGEPPRRDPVRLTACQVLDEQGTGVLRLACLDSGEEQRVPSSE